MRQTPLFRPALAAVVALWLTGCGQALPGTTVATPAPPVYAPPATTTSTPTPTPSATDPAYCGRDRPAGNPTIGTARHGAYAGQQLPEGWTLYGSEAEVTAAIQKLYDARKDWACFQSFYPGASSVFKKKGRL
jgi:hypothetical protein